MCLSSSLIPSYFTSDQTTCPLQSPLFLICPCCRSVGNKSHRKRLCCNQLAEGAGTERAFTGWLNLSQCLPWQSGSLILATTTISLKFNKPARNRSPLGWLANKKWFSHSNAPYWYKWIVTSALENVPQCLHPLMLFNPWMWRGGQLGLLLAHTDTSLWINISIQPHVSS